MKRMFSMIFASLLCSGSYAAITNTSEVGAILNTVENNYGPLVYKEKLFDFDWESFKSYHGQKLLNSLSTEEFYVGVSEMLGSLKDSHVSVTIPSTYAKALPLEFSYLPGSTFVSFYGQRAAGQCPRLKLGDKLINFNGHTPDEYRNILSKYSSAGNKRTDATYLTLLITRYSESKGMPKSIVKGSSARLVLAGNSGQYECEIDWDEAGFPLVSRSITPETLAKARRADKGARFFGNTRLSSNWLNALKKLEWIEKIGKMQDRLVKLRADHLTTVFARTAQGEASKGVRKVIGSPAPFFKLPSSFKKLTYPQGFTEIVQASGLFAGTFNHMGKTIGFLRIPSYTPQELSLSLLALRYVFGKLDQITEHLIIDQTNNPGGYVAYSDWIIAALVPKLNSKVHMQFQVRPTQDYLRTYASLINEIKSQMSASSNPKLKGMAELYGPLMSQEFSKVRTAFENGAYLSQPVSLAVVSYFMEEIISHEVSGQFVNGRPFGALLQALTGMDLTKRQRYTKPVSMIINELDFSGGDATPANLQDYGRVKLYGVNTAGAGGSVGSYQHKVLNHFDFRLTNSLMYRPINRGTPYAYVENIGVKPDVNFEVTSEDYKNNFSGYFGRLLQVIF